MRTIVERTGLALVLAGAMGAAQAFMVDGKFGGTAEGYSLGFDVSFDLDDGSTVAGGRLYFGTDTGGDGDHYLYFAMPKDFVDNSLGANSVGWGNRAKGHTFKDLLNSDGLGRTKNTGSAGRFVLNPVNAGGQTLDLTIDYIATDDDKNPSLFRSGGIGTVEMGQDNTGLKKNEGLISADPAGVAGGVKQIATSMEYNVVQHVPQSDITGYDDKNPVGLLQDSPEVQADANGDPVTDANGDYQCVDPNDAVCADWIFEVGYEMRFDAAMFDNRWTSAQDVLAFVDLGEAHVSPHKTSGKFQDMTPTCDPTFGNGCDGSNPPPPNPVPEPATGLLLGFGLLGLGAARRRRQAL